jgi:hypothetical protein
MSTTKDGEGLQEISFRVNDLVALQRTGITIAIWLRIG